MPDRWGKCLLGTCYSLWFLHLPAMLQVSSQPAAILHQAYELLVKMQKLRLDPMEEVRTGQWWTSLQDKSPDARKITTSLNECLSLF